MYHTQFWFEQPERLKWWCCSGSQAPCNVLSDQPVQNSPWHTSIWQQLSGSAIETSSHALCHSLWPQSWTWFIPLHYCMHVIYIGCKTPKPNHLDVLSLKIIMWFHTHQWFAVKGAVLDRITSEVSLSVRDVWGRFSGYILSVRTSCGLKYTRLKQKVTGFRTLCRWWYIGWG